MAHTMADLSLFSVGGWSAAAVAMASLLTVLIKTRPAWKKAESDAVTALHTDYGKHIKRLQQENGGLRDRLSNLEREYDEHRKECRAETDNLHELVRGLKQQIDGLMRDLAQHSNSTAVLLRDNNV